MRRSCFAAAALSLACVTLSSCVPWTVRPIGSGAESDGAGSLTPAAFVDSLWDAKLLPAVKSAAVDARTLLDALAASPEAAMTAHARREGPGAAYFIVKGGGVVLDVDTSSRAGLALVDVAPFDGRPDVSIQIGPVLRGVSLRDATGLVRFSDFVNQLQFADVGNELNARVLKSVLAPIDPSALRGRPVRFTGTLAAEASAEPPLRDLVPVEFSVEARP